MFVNLRPNSSYTWSVHINGIEGSSDIGNWNFTTENGLFPQNDRSIDITIADSIYLPQHLSLIHI